MTDNASRRHCGTCAHAVIGVSPSRCIYVCRDGNCELHGSGGKFCRCYLPRLEWVPRNKTTDESWLLRLGDFTLGAIGRWSYGGWWASYCKPPENYKTSQEAGAALLEALHLKGIDQ